MEITMAPGSWLLYYSTIADIGQESIFDFNTTPPPPKKFVNHKWVSGGERFG